jgi:hypothetical protein
MTERRITIRVPEPLYRRLRAEAAWQGCSLNSQAVTFLEACPYLGERELMESVGRAEVRKP